MCSLINVMSSTFSDADHRAYIAEHWSDTLEESIRRIDDFRARRPEHPILDVRYADLARDPVATVRRLRQPRARRRARCVRGGRGYLAAHPRGEFGGHGYDVAEFGLTEAAVRERFRDYIARYGVEPEHLADQGV